MNKIIGLIIALVIVVIIVIAGILFLFIPTSSETGSVPLFEGQEPPTLFGKDDYQVETRGDGTYIVVEKVGLTAKVPEGWTIEKQETPDIETKYWVRLSSSDVVISHEVITNGCSINLSAGIEKINNQNTQDSITLLTQNSANSEYIKEGYEFEIKSMNNHSALLWLSPQKELFGQFAGADIPVGDNVMIAIDTAFPPGYQEQCQPIWQEFLDNLVIK